MAITDGENGFNVSMPVAPAYGMYGGNGGFGGFGGDSWGWIILLLLCANGGWGGFGGFGGGFGNMQLGYDFPWLMNGQQNIMSNTNNGFRDQMINDNVTSIRDGISGLSTQLCGATGDIQNSLCNGFAGVNATVNGAQNALAQQMYTNQIADLERSYASQTAVTQEMNTIAMNQQNGICENRAGIADLKYTVATENCADRTAAYQNTRDIIDSQTRGTQAVLDKLCQLELDGVKQNYENRIAGMQNVIDGLSAQVNAADRRVAMGEEVDALYNRLSNCPVPSTPVYGRTPIFTCNQQANPCGCGCGNGSF